MEVDEDLFEEFDILCKTKKISVDAAFNVFMSVFVKNKDYPFKLSLSEQLIQSYTNNIDEWVLFTNDVSLSADADTR